MRWVIGVDEAGRGPLAGPVAVGLVAVAEGFDVAVEFPGVADSKALSEKKREAIFQRLVAMAGGAEGYLGTTGSLRSLGYGAGVRFTVEFESAEAIDRDGIAVVIRRALARGVEKLAKDESGDERRSQTSRAFQKSDFPDSDVRSRFHLLLDGALRAPPEYAQETIIGGDASVPLISLASVAAKVVRDRLMCALARQHPTYGFERHKGYGTRAHYDALKRHGPCTLHRRSFLHLDFMGK